MINIIGCYTALKSWNVHKAVRRESVIKVKKKTKNLVAELWLRAFDDDCLQSSKAKTVRKMDIDLCAKCKFYAHFNICHHLPIIGL